ncbi:hypothetical protein LTR49_026563 [Elasticomyces elasticus]|nr:hypothetical protein LTR49_026563 [Elasticomyces elasticus]
MPGLSAAACQALNTLNSAIDDSKIVELFDKTCAVFRLDHPDSDPLEHVTKERLIIVDALVNGQLKDKRLRYALQLRSGRWQLKQSAAIALFGLPNIKSADFTKALIDISKLPAR